MNDIAPFANITPQNILYAFCPAENPAKELYSINANCAYNYVTSRLFYFKSILVVDSIKL